jgi:Tol biopolymer transport system component
MYALSAETGERRRLWVAPLIDADAAFSPDGRSLLFIRTFSVASRDVFVRSLSPDLNPVDEPRALTQARRTLRSAIWTPDGKEVLFSAGEFDDTPLWRMPVSGGTPRRLTERGEIETLAVSPPAHRLVFTQATRELDIYRAELTAGGAEVKKPAPFLTSTRVDRRPAYSPDGSRVAFVSLRSGTFQLWVSDADGRNATALTAFERGEVDVPDWSPDGQQIVFVSSASGTREAYVIDAAGGKPRKLESLGVNVGAVDWSRDGRTLIWRAVREGKTIMLQVPFAGGTPVPLPVDTAIQSVDGTLLYYMRDNGQDNTIWSMPMAGGEPRAVFRFEGQGGGLVETKAGIYHLSNPPGRPDRPLDKPSELFFYRFPNGPLTKVAGVEGMSQYGFSISPDGRYLLYTKYASQGSDLMLVENFK